MADRYERVLADSTWDATAKEWTHNCGTVLMAKNVHFSVWDSPIPLSGSGQVRLITVPYCPSCEDEPASHGVITEAGLR